VRRGSDAINGAVVASDGVIYGVQRDLGLCGFAGGKWQPVADAPAHVDGIVWSAAGTDGAVVVKHTRTRPARRRM
jgi:hypothetical protein